MSGSCNRLVKASGFCAFVASCFSVFPLLAQAEFPELPVTMLQQWSPPLRERIQTACDKARRNPEDAASIGELGMLIHAYQQYDFAERCSQRAHDLDPESFLWSYYLGVLQSLAGKNEAAIDSLRKAVGLDPAYLPARLRLAESLFASGELQESGRLYQQAVKEYPDLPVSHYGLGRVEAARGDVSAALLHYQKACDLFPAFGAAHYALALAYRDLGEKAKAEEHFTLYQKGRTAPPAMEGPLLNAVKALGAGARHRLAEAINLESENRIQESIEEHERALELEPDLVQAHLNLLSLYGRLKQWEKAEEHFRAATAINPNLVEAHYNHGMLLSNQGRYAEAAKAFRRAVEINPFYSAAHNNLGQMLERLDDSGAAERHYRQAVENAPTNRLARFNLGRILAAAGRHKEAADQFLQILTPQDAQTPLFTYALASVYIRSGDLEKGIHYATQAKKMAKSMGQADLVSTIETDLKGLDLKAVRR